MFLLINYIVFPFSLQQASKPVSPQLALSLRYFIMKSSNIRNIEISQQKGIWSTTTNNENRLAKAFLENDVIILIFSVQGSGQFQVALTENIMLDVIIF